VSAIALFVSIVLATFALVLGYALHGLWAGVLFIVALGAFWLLAQRRGWDWIASVELVIFVGTAVVGLGLTSRAGWMLLGVVAALAAWDLDHFAQRMKKGGHIEGAQALERRHLLRLLVVSGLGLLLAAVALEIKITLQMGTALLLGVLAILCLSRAVGFLRRESD